MSFIRNSIESLFGGSDAARAATEGAELAAAGQREALEYLQAIDQPLLDFREDALARLGGFYGLGGEFDQQAIIDQVQASPFFQTNLQEIENSILRNQAATGGLRSGGTQEALAFANTQALQGATGQLLGGLQQFAFPPLASNQQAALLSGIGQTQALGVTGAEQARQSAFGQGLNFAANAAGLFI